VSDSKYTADITKGIALSAGGLNRRWRWPESIPGLGPRALGKFSRCEFCPKGIHIAVAGTWAVYGGRAICETCAVLKAEAGA
jgi:hypothetical protein